MIIIIIIINSIIIIIIIIKTSLSEKERGQHEAKGLFFMKNDG